MWKEAISANLQTNANFTWGDRKLCQSQAKIQTIYLLSEVQTAATMDACM